MSLKKIQLKKIKNFEDLSKIIAINFFAHLEIFQLNNLHNLKLCKNKLKSREK